MRALCLIALLSVVAAVAVAAPARAADAGAGVAPPPIDAPVASAALSEREVTLGRSFLLLVRVVYADGIKVDLPANLGLPDSIEELSRTSSDRTAADGSHTREFEVELIAFGLGQMAISPVPITYSARGDVAQVLTNPLSLEVVGVIGDGPESLRDIAAPVEVRRDDQRVLWAGAAVAGLIVLLLASMWLRRFRERRSAVREAAARRRLPPAEEALARLGALEARGDLEQADLKPTYLEMSEIVKAYLGRRFGFPANELTTLEIRNELLARPGNGAAEALIRPWLEAADLVKFANAGSSPEEARRALYDARLFVEKTRREAEGEGEGEREHEEEGA